MKVDAGSSFLQGSSVLAYQVVLGNSGDAVSSVGCVELVDGCDNAASMEVAVLVEGCGDATSLDDAAFVEGCDVFST